MQYFVGIGGDISTSVAHWNMAYTSLTVITNTVSTALIIICIVRATGVAGSRTYVGIIEILVESSFLYSITYMVYLVLYVHNIYAPYYSETFYYPEAMLSAVTVSHNEHIQLPAHFMPTSVLLPP